jgi:hypothetical protein
LEGVDVKLQWVSLPAVVAAGVVLQTIAYVAERPACCQATGAREPETLAAVMPADNAKGTASEKPAALTVLSEEARELKQAFNADQGAVRVLLIVSPRCPFCRSGAAIVERALARVQSSQLKVYVVWIHRLYRDNREAAHEAMALVSDKRARHFWDGGGWLGKEYGKIVSLPRHKKFAWDVYFVFGPKAKWTDAPPKPDFWMHQLGGPETGNMLDGEKFRQEIVRRLP